MKITFIGLSCFLIENQGGYKILVDPFEDSPEWSLGPVFPSTIDNMPLGANITLISEPDADHSRSVAGLLQAAPNTKPSDDPFPNLNLKGTIVYEFNGEMNIAWHYTIDGFRLAHFADNSHLLTKQQLEELGRPDIIFISPPKAHPDNQEAITIIRNNIALLKPKIIIWSHHIAPQNLPVSDDPQTLRDFFHDYFQKNAHTNKGYKSGNDFMPLCYALENAITMNQEYLSQVIQQPTLEISSDMITKGKIKPTSILFRAMAARSVTNQ